MRELNEIIDRAKQRKRTLRDNYKTGKIPSAPREGEFSSNREERHEQKAKFQHQSNEGRDFYTHVTGGELSQLFICCNLLSSIMERKTSLGSIDESVE